MSQQDNRMTAIVCHGPEDDRVERIERPHPGPSAMAIRISAGGICAGDCTCRSGARMFRDDRANGVAGRVKPPVGPGHEFFGVVDEPGPGAAAPVGAQAGDTVIAEQIAPCDRCRGGQYGMREVRDIFGFQRRVADGGRSDCMLIPRTAGVHAIPRGAPLADAAIIEPLSRAIDVVGRSEMRLDDVVVIAVAGPIGLMVVQVAHLRTPRKLIVIDMVRERRELALEFGADLVIDPAAEDADAVVRAHTGGYGCDVYIEATGSPGGVTQGLALIRKLGRFVEFSVVGRETGVDWPVAGDREELDVRGARLGPHRHPIAIDLLDRDPVTSAGIVTHDDAFEKWDEAFRIADPIDPIKALPQPASGAG